MKIFKENVDERERMEMYTIEHYGFWFMFWALLFSIFVQIFFTDMTSFKQVAAEWIVFMIAAGISCIAYAKGGHWSYRSSEPTIKSYLFYSLVGSVVFSVVVCGGNVYKGYLTEGKTIVVVGLVYFAVLFAILFISLFLAGTFIRKRKKKMEEQFDDKEDLA